MKNIKNSNRNNKFIKSTLTWNEKFEYPHGPYSVSNIYDHFKYILNKNGEKTNNSSIRIYVSKIGLPLEQR